MCKAFVGDVYAPDFDLQNFSRTFGVDTGVHIERWIDIVLDGRYTFESIRRATGIDLVVCATNLNQRKPAYFSADRTPTIDVATAIRMSCAIPLYFSAVTLEDEVFVDGALCDNFPYEWVANRENIRFPMGIKYTSCDQRGGQVRSLEQYLAALLQCATNQQHTRENANVLELDCGDAKVFDFKSPKALKKLFKAGVVQTGDWIKKRN
jgi:predicted acylesterase/phospholipase RssA